MTYVLIATILSFTVYNLAVLLKYGLLQSISESYYYIKHKPVFTLTLWSWAAGIIAMGQSPLTFLSGSALAFVGAAAAFKSSLTRSVHFVSAAICILAAMLSMIIEHQQTMIPTIWLVLSIIVSLLNTSKLLYFVEMLAFLAIISFFALILL